MSKQSIKVPTEDYPPEKLKEDPQEQIEDSNDDESYKSVASSEDDDDDRCCTSCCCCGEFLADWWESLVGTTMDCFDWGRSLCCAPQGAD